jgi:hypothetical protein
LIEAQKQAAIAALDRRHARTKKCRREQNVVRGLSSIAVAIG